jgi:homoserine kinase
MSGSASAPASSANLGPGFDVIGLALDLRCRVEVVPAPAMTVNDGDGPVPLDDQHMLSRVTDAVGSGPVAISVTSDVPRTRGLGSSAAVVAATGAAAVRAMGGEPEPDRIYETVAAIEGHGDNAAATVYGGLMAIAADGPYRLEISDALVPVVGVPYGRLPTAAAREAIPGLVPTATAARGLSRIVALVEGLRTGDPERLAGARGDEFHELPRAKLSPLTGAMIEAAIAAGALHAAWSGAGPTAIAFAIDDSAENVARSMAETLGDAGEAMIVAVDYEGLR